MPRAISKGLSPLRTQNKNAVEITPMTSVMGFTSPKCAVSEPAIWGSVWPWAETPKICLSWLTAIKIPDAVIKPAITGWLRKLARKPSFNSPIASKIAPDITASVNAAMA